MPGIVLEIEVDASGIRTVRVFGDSWSQSGEAAALLQRIQPFLDLIHAELTGESERSIQ